MDPGRVASIQDWPVPTSTHDVQVFLGFTNFYRRFIEGYSRISAPMTALLRKQAKPFRWTAAADEAFRKLRQQFLQAPVLRHFDPELPIRLETDASAHAISAILTQPGETHHHPVAFWSRKLIDAEENYATPDTELLAIVKAFQHWRHYLEGAQYPVRVLTDHSNLQWFNTTKTLTRRQARWAEELSGFDFVIEYRAGKKNPADGPSRRPDYTKKTTQIENVRPAFLKFAATSCPEPLLAEILASTQTDALLSRLPAPLPDPWKKEDSGLHVYDSRIYVPQVVRVRVLRDHHDTPMAGHFGWARTLELVSRNYYWPGMSKDVKDYVRGCATCARSKPSTHKPHGELMSLPAPSRPWTQVTFDMITDLPESGREKYTCILVFVDRLTKMSHFVPCHKTLKAPQLADCFLDNVIRLHGVPRGIVTDRAPTFLSHFWQRLCERLQLHHSPSTAFHPQTDGQTERMNTVLESYLRAHVNYMQDDWVSWLPVAEFAYNNSCHATTKTSPFRANYGYDPDFEVLPEHETAVPQADEHASRMRALHAHLVDRVIDAQNLQAQYYDAKHLPRSYEVGDKVYLKTTNIRTQRPSKKLDSTKIGPFCIVKRIGLQSYRLDLQGLRVHDVFHVSLLEPASDPVPGQVLPPPPPVVVGEEEEWEVEQILDSRLRYGKLQYLVRWKDSPPSDDSWQPAGHVVHAPDLLQAFHEAYPHRPRTSTRRPRY